MLLPKRHLHLRPVSAENEIGFADCRRASSHWTVRAYVVVWVVDPEVPVMVIVDVPDGVVSLEPPQPITSEPARSMAASRSCPDLRTHARERLRASDTVKSPASPAKASAAGPRDGPLRPSGRGSAAAVWTLVCNVSVAVAATLPVGVTDAGVMVQLACCGAPEQVNATGWLNPPTGVMEIVDVMEPPGASVPLDGDRPMVKSAATGAVMVTATAEDVEAALPPSPP